MNRCNSTEFDSMFAGITKWSYSLLRSLRCTEVVDGHVGVTHGVNVGSTPAGGRTAISLSWRPALKQECDTR